ncbi:MAG: nitroreductase family protein [Bacteriovoracaceae bacterium]|nr:nitroreductase family protein [Bacteriovoracaceae bacterium]
MKNFNQLLEHCRTYHAFQRDSVEDAELIEALECSLKAPNHKFTFPWKYVWIRGEVKTELAELALEIKSKGEKLPPAKAQAIKDKFLNPSVVAFCQKISDDEFTRKEDYATMSCSVQLFALSLAEKGIGYKWSTAKVIRDERLYKALKLDPTEYEIIGLLMAGRPCAVPKQRKRPSLDDVLTMCDSNS